MGLGWRNLITYSKPFHLTNRGAVGILDSLQDLVPISTDFEKGLRDVVLAKWLERCEKLGLITLAEHQDVRSFLVEVL